MITDLIRFPDFFQLFLFSGAAIGFLVTAGCALYAKRGMRKAHRTSSENAPEYGLLNFLFRLSVFDGFVLFYFSAYFFVRMMAGPSTTQTSLIYFLAVFGYTCAIFALSLPAISAAFIATGARRAR